MVGKIGAEVRMSMKRSKRKQSAGKQKKEIAISVFITIACLLVATLLAFGLFALVPNNSANIALVYILALILIVRLTKGYFYGLSASIVAVICVNYLFTYPYFALNFTLTGYPITFIEMLSVTLLISTMTVNMKQQAQIIVERDRMLAEAEKEKMRANLLRAISHDLRTPLTSILGSSASYLENQDVLSEEEKNDMIQQVQEDATWLLNMVENLLTVTRIYNQEAKVKKTEEPVEEIVAAAIQRIKKRLPEAQIEVNVPETFLMIPMDGILIEQVLINLLENAIVHAKSTAPIQCFVKDHPDMVSFHVRDYGVGISQDRLQTIFDGMPYHGNEQSDSNKGIGIGLSICKTIVNAHDGIIDVCNHEKGSEFYFSIPKGNQ